MNKMKDLPQNPESKILMGHEDLIGFANHLGINFERLKQINQKNAEVIKKRQNPESKF
jgi:hypothetical protein